MIARILSLIGGITGFGSIGSAAIATGGLFAFVISLWTAFAWHYEKRGADKVITKIERASEINVKKAMEARRSVEAIPADMLNDPYRRD